MIKDKYNYYSGNIPVNVTIESKKEEFVLVYEVNISQISANTELILDKIRDELVEKVKLGITDIVDPKKMDFVKEKFRETIVYLIEKYFPDISNETKDFFTTYLMHKSFGLGRIEIILNDSHLEEIVVNNADEPIWVYHRQYGWLKTNVILKNEGLIKHYSTLIGRKVGRSITSLSPLLDAHLDTGDRVNATLFPITTKGNTITIRKFSEKPITVTDMLKNNTLSLSAAALIWTGIQYEMSTLISGGTASGKCIMGDSEILLSDKRIKIRNLVEEELKNNKIEKIDDGFISNSNKEILSFNPKTLKIEKKKIEKVWKRKSPEYLIKVKTKSGRNITCTPEHPFFILDSEIKQVRADELNNNCSIAVPRHLSFDIKKYEFNLESLKPYKILEDNEEYSTMKLYNNSNSIRIPKKLSVELSRLIGYIMGDGHITKNLSGIKFFGEEDEILNDYMDCINKIFGIKSEIKKYKNRCRQIDINSKLLATYFNEVLEIPKGKKSDILRIPDYILFSDKIYLREFIKALFECDCYVDKIRSSLDLTTKSKDLAKDITIALEIFGIISRIRRTFKKAVNSNHKGDFYYNVGFAGKTLFDFNNEIGLISKRKSERINNSIKLKFSSNVDMIPNINNHIKYLKENLNLYEKDIKGNLSREAISRYICDIRTPSRDSLLTVVNAIEEKIPQSLDVLEIPARINFLKNLSNSDILWDSIISTEKIKSEEKWVYDLTVEDNHTFIANNIIAHNTSILGVVSNFFPPNQRIISVEDTRELMLSKHLHWVPMVTREPNVEGKGEISMLDLIVNSLRMRPDRIVVGEIRKKREAEVLFEAMHTGHSVCATLHANNSEEVITRLTNPPIDISKTLLPAISMIVIMYRNRRTGIRRVLEVSEITKDAIPNILMQYDMSQDRMLNANQSVKLLPELQTQTGLSIQEINQDLKDKVEILKWFVKKDINDVNGVGKVVANYYTNKEALMNFIRKG
ncbi:Flp pilus assembly complex ATPase component TadA [Candidatus Woesearchaeota archaeon]|nr:Flp pilus assembly complex ATPase component TadA [Candidatus Woesearchaeota archaeon]